MADLEPPLPASPTLDAPVPLARWAGWQRGSLDELSRAGAEPAHVPEEDAREALLLRIAIDRAPVDRFPPWAGRISRPAEGELLRLGARVGSEGIEPVWAAVWARGERVGEVLEAPDVAAQRWLHDPAFALSRWPEVLLDASFDPSGPSLIGEPSVETAAEALTLASHPLPSLRVRAVAALWAMSDVQRRAWVDGVQVDLAEVADLYAARLIEGLSVLDPGARLEAAVANLLYQRESRLPVEELLRTAVWVSRVLLLSPFHGGDAERLAGRLERHVGPDAPFSAGAGAIRPELPSLLAAMIARPQASASLVSLLAPVAARVSTAAERQHLSRRPPCLARELLQRVEQPWLAGLSADALEDQVGSSEEADQLTLWRAVHREGGQLGAHRKRILEHWWARWRAEGAPPSDWCLAGISLLPDLNPAQGEGLLSAIERAPTRWVVGLLHLFAQARPPAPLLDGAVRSLLERVDGDVIPLQVPAAKALLLLVRRGTVLDTVADQLLLRMGPELRRNPDLRIEASRAGRPL